MKKIILAIAAITIVSAHAIAQRSAGPGKSVNFITQKAVEYKNSNSGGNTYYGSPTKGKDSKWYASYSAELPSATLKVIFVSSSQEGKDAKVHEALLEQGTKKYSWAAGSKNKASDSAKIIAFLTGKKK